MRRRQSYKSRDAPFEPKRKIPEPRSKYGAPPGGRVHWLLWELSGDFKERHKIHYNYAKHCYHIESKNHKNYHCFTIMQTSAQSWHVTYFDSINCTFELQRLKNYFEVADYCAMKDIGHNIKTNYLIKENYIK